MASKSQSGELARSRDKAAPARAHRTPAALPLWESELERFFDDMRLPWARWWRPARRLLRREAFIEPPAVDVIDEKDHVLVKAELPGMGKNDVEVEVTDSTLTIRGEKKHEEETKDENFYRCEREYGSVYRAIDLPAAVKPSDVTATFNNGVLEIRMPKTDEAKRKAVKVAVR